MDTDKTSSEAWTEMDTPDMDMSPITPPLVNESQGTSTAVAVPNTAAPAEQLWICRPAETKKTDGLLYIPYIEDTMAQGKPVCWYFGMDASGSMNLSLYGKNLTRWQVTLKLFDKVVSDLQSQGRNDDTITVVIFNDSTRVVLANVPVPAVGPSDVVFHGISPDRSTNLSAANSIIHTLMCQNSQLKAGTHQAAEIFFTDGDANTGLVTPTELQLQKTELYDNLATTIGQRPFLWCGAISTGANWKLVRSMSQASHISLWAYIKEEEMHDFAGEVGGVVATVVNMQTAEITVEKPMNDAGQRLVEIRTVMLLPGVTNLFYLPTKPRTQALEAQAESLVSLYKVKHLLEQNNKEDVTLTLDDIKVCLKKVQSRKKFDDKFINESLYWTNVFETAKASALKDLEDLSSAVRCTGFAQLEHQISAPRSAYAQSALIRETSIAYVSAYAMM